MTPVELYRRLEAFRWRLKLDVDHQTRAAWLTAALSRSKRMPSLKKLLKDDKQARRLTRDEAADEWAALSDLKRSPDSG